MGNCKQLQHSPPTERALRTKGGGGGAADRRNGLYRSVE